MKALTFGVAAAAIAFAAPAAAQLDDSFDGEAGGGTTVTNYASFANFDVVEGSVDLLYDPNSFGLGCAGGAGSSCVDLDGSTGNGGFLLTKSSYSFAAGDQVTLSFDLRGNGRGGEDDYLAGFLFNGGADLLGINDFSGGIADIFGAGSYVAGGFIASDAPFSNYALTFRAGNSGSFRALVGTNSADNIGPILDNFSISIAAVPEPSQWLLLILGFGAIGAAMRRPRAQLRFA